MYGQEPTIDDDPIDYFDRSTTPAPTQSDYIASVTFSTPVDFNHPNSKGKSLTLFGKQFIVDNGTTASKLVLRSAQDSSFILTFIDGSPVREGRGEDPIEGTQVDFDGTLSVFNNLHIFVSAPDSDSDALTEAQSIRDPVFNTFEFDYRGLDIPLDKTNSQRERVFVAPVRNDRVVFGMADHRGIGLSFSFVGIWNGSVVRLAYDSDTYNRIRVVERLDVQEDEYVVVGNEDEGYLLMVREIYNFSSGYSDDFVTLWDVYTHEEFTVKASSEGRGTVSVGGRTYSFEYVAPSYGGMKYIRLDYPDSGPGRGIFYPTIQTSKGAKVSFYEPQLLQLDILAAFHGGSNGSAFGLQLPDGDGYAPEVMFTPLGNGVYFVNGSGGTGTLNTASSSSSVTFFIGELQYKVKGTGTMNRAILRLVDVKGADITLPAVVLFEEKDDSGREEAVIVTLEGTGTDMNGLGVADVQSTWAGANASFSTWNQFESDSDIWGRVDRYATWALLNHSDIDQRSVRLFYPDTQAYARVYALERF